MSEVLYNKMSSFRGDLALSSDWSKSIISEEHSKILDAIHLWCFYLLDLVCVSSEDTDLAFRQFSDWERLVTSLNLVSLQEVCESTWILVNNNTGAITYDFVKRTFKECASNHFNEQDRSRVGGFLTPLVMFAKSVMPKVTVSGDRIFPDHPTRYFLSALFRFPFRLNVKMDITEKLIEKYVAFEEKISKQDFSQPVANVVRQVLTEWLQDWKPENMLYEHGPGTTADQGRNRVNKSISLIPSSQLLELFGEENVPWTGLTCKNRVFRNKIIFVPKSLKTYRVISAEPAVLQFLQHGISNSLSVYCKEKLKWWNLESQEQMGKLCRTGSQHGTYDTIDLSDASDSVTTALVKYLFADCLVLPYLLSTRSTKCVLPDKRCISLSKFAPMGSATCFPVETLIFGAICEAAARYLNLSHLRDPYRVYGDDMIVRHSFSYVVLDFLAALNFSVNVQKSYFSPCKFKESCGYEYYDGVDIKPLRIPRKFSGFQTNNPSNITALIDLANLSFDHGCKMTRRYLIFQIKKLDAAVPFSYSGEVGLKSFNPSNFHLRRRRKNGEQCVLGSSTRSILVSRYDDEARYTDWHVRKFVFSEDDDYSPPLGDTISIRSVKATACHNLYR